MYFGYSVVRWKQGCACCANALESFTETLSKQKYIILHIMNWFWASILILVSRNRVSVLDVSAHGVEQNVSFVAPKFLTRRDGLVSCLQRLWAFRRSFFSIDMLFYMSAVHFLGAATFYIYIPVPKVSCLSESQKCHICIKLLNNNIKVTRYTYDIVKLITTTV